MSLTEIVHEGVDWVCLAQDRVQWQALVNTCNEAFRVRKWKGIS
jgi:hypothetical protein